MTIPEKTTLDVLIQPSDAISEELNREIDTLDHLAFFEEGETDDILNIEWAASSQWEVLGRLEGRLVSRIAIIQRSINVGDQTVRIAGIGGVATHPDWRRNGFARRLLQASLDFIRSTNAFDFSMLFCADEMIPYYGKSGYSQVHNPLYIWQKGQRVPFNDNKMVLPVSGMSWPEGEVDVQGAPW